MASSLDPSSMPLFYAVFDVIVETGAAATRLVLDRVERRAARRAAQAARRAAVRSQGTSLQLHSVSPRRPPPSAAGSLEVPTQLPLDRRLQTLAEEDASPLRGSTSSGGSDAVLEGEVLRVGGGASKSTNQSGATPVPLLPASPAASTTSGVSPVRVVRGASGTSHASSESADGQGRFGRRVAGAGGEAPSSGAGGGASPAGKGGVFTIGGDGGAEM